MEFSCGPTFMALSHVTSLNGLLFIEKLDWEWVKKLCGIFLQLRSEDLGHRARSVAPVSKPAPAKIAWSSFENASLPNLDAIWQRRF
jgi:hypothetical protein